MDYATVKGVHPCMAAPSVFGWVVGVAVTKDPLGPLQRVLHPIRPDR